MKRATALAVLALALLLAGCGGSRCSGNEVVFRASSESKSQPITPQGMQLAREIVEARLQKLGVSSPAVAIRDGNELVVQYAGTHDPVGTADVLDITGRLQFFDFERSLAPPTVSRYGRPLPQPSLYGLLETVQKQADQATPQSYYLFKASASHPVVQGPAPDIQQLLLPYRGAKQPPHAEVLKVPAGREPVECRGVENCLGAKSGESWYLLKLPPALSSKDLVASGITQAVDPNSGQPIVTLQFTRAGSEAFRRITRAEYDRGRLNAAEAGQLTSMSRSAINQYAGHNAIVLDGRLEQTPYIDYTDPSLSQGIVGNAQITEPSEAVASRTAVVLQTGSLPYTLREVARSSCSQ